MDSPLGLLVVGLLGLCSVGVHGRPHCPVRPFVTSNINDDINELKKSLILDANDLIGSTVFLQDIKELNGTSEHEQWLFLNATLNVYLDIFSNMLKEKRSEEVEKSLNNLRGKVEELKKIYYGNRIKTRIQKLAAIKTTDQSIQKKALNEFMEVFQEASKVGPTLHERNCTKS
ncbi:hypothetical protein DPEC_G00082840 [Dallia pectoralis]|uniref:Uncharacterized protein n=1 Tax=Dallia pectoralis TaxID=75939 RepID=A0ACC2GYV8_DALPE|nr:hypothetical protein DPEC_G00082840 [Dallia pectoralis]